MRLRSTIRKAPDLSSAYGLPLLGCVPHSTALERAALAPAPSNLAPLPPADAEAFRSVRARLRYFNIDRQLRTLLIASPLAREGKTTVARNLAITAATSGSVVLLIEANPREPALAAQLALGPRPGLSDVLSGSRSLWMATQPAPLAHPNGAPGHPPALDVLVAGEPAPGIAEALLGSPAIASMLALARETYDLVVIDTPALEAGEDIRALMRRTDGVVLVGRLGRTRHRAARRWRERLEGAGAPLLGVVANCAKEGTLATRNRDGAMLDGSAGPVPGPALRPGAERHLGAHSNGHPRLRSPDGATAASAERLL